MATTKRENLDDAFALPPRKPRTPVADDRAQQFVSPTTVRTSKKSQYRRDGPGERINAYLPPDLLLEIRTIALHQRRSLSDAVTEAMREWVQRNRVKE